MRDLAVKSSSYVGQALPPAWLSLFMDAAMQVSQGESMAKRQNSGQLTLLSFLFNEEVTEISFNCGLRNHVFIFYSLLY
jgi:hypothetical protein